MEQDLLKAANENVTATVSSLLQANLTINVNFTDELQMTALHHAAGNYHVGIVQVLLAHPGINVNLKNISGFTPFSLACGRESVGKCC